MIPRASNHASRALTNYIERIENGHWQGSFQESAYKLLNLLFAYKRSQYKLHLRWNKVWRCMKINALYDYLRL